MMVPAPARRILLFVFTCLATTARGEALAADLERQMDRAWHAAWTRFYLPEVETFGDYLSSDEPGREQGHLPTAAEVARQYPNPCGYGTGMEDGAILGGAMLSLLCDRFESTGEEALRADAAKVFSGLRRCATVHGVSGFVARNVCPEDGRSVYINSSRDQVTHFAHGLWRYHRSPLADERTKEEIAVLLGHLADRMIEFATPENDYDFGRADGTRCPLRICRMWEVQAHEAARLPMIFATAWETAGHEIHRTGWRRHAAEAIAQSASPGPDKPAYALLQMQCSLETLHELEGDPARKDEAHRHMRHVRDLAGRRLVQTLARIAEKSPEEMCMLGPDWRKVPLWRDQKGYPNPQWGAYREIWHLTREAGEAALTMLMVDPASLSDDERAAIRTMISRFDYERNSSCGILYHLAAYWKARRHGVFPAS